MELEKIQRIEAATWVNREEVLRLGVAILFIVGIILYVSSRGEVSPMLIIAGMIGGYMALNIGANDVANNVGPAVADSGGFRGHNTYFSRYSDSKCVLCPRITGKCVLCPRITPRITPFQILSLKQGSHLLR